jgi:Zn-dependent protease
MDPLSTLLIALPVLIFSVVCHEVAHAWVALREGDTTAYMLGRITMNPVPHLDPIGSLLVPAILAMSGTGILFGWAKPVPVNGRNFRNYKRGDILVSLAGVAANILLAFLFAILLVPLYLIWQQAPAMTPSFQVAEQMFVFGVLINFVLAIFNLIPIPPLDGSHVLYHLLPPRLGAQYRSIGSMGMLILLALLFLGGFRFIAVPVHMLSGILIGTARAVAGV